MILKLFGEAEFAQFLWRQFLETTIVFLLSASTASATFGSLGLLLSFPHVQFLLVLKLLGETQFSKLSRCELLEAAITIGATGFRAATTATGISATLSFLGCFPFI